MDLLEANPNPFGGIVTAPDALPDDPADFRDRLTNSIQSWKAEEYKVVWMEVPSWQVGGDSGGG